VLEPIRQEDELYVFRPSEMKFTLLTLIVNFNQLLPKRKSFETSENMKLNQVIAMVKDFL
jgi:hypothetical protein